MSAPDLILKSINLEAFEKLVYLSDGSPEATEAVCRELFVILGQTREGSGFLTADDTAQVVLWTRVAGAITAFLINPKHGLTRDGYISLCALHSQLHAIFKASAYETMDHILCALSDANTDDSTKRSFTSEQAILKLLVCWSLDSEIQIDFDAVAQNAPEATAIAMIGMLSTGGTHSPASYERRLMLMAKRHIIANSRLPQQLIQSAADCYMHCSYVDAPDKHEIKRVINDKMFETISSLLPVNECTRRLQKKDRPTILLPLEWFGSHHAMYRCYAPSLLQLKERFRIVALFRDSQLEVDDEARALFDACIKMPPNTASIQSVIDAIADLEPDIIYYPSLGMAAWYVALSNFRLAPIQVISPGHPATSMSKHIDYIVSDGDLFGDAKDYTERLVPLPTGTARYIERANWKRPERIVRADGVVRIAIPAMVIKLVPPFLETLARIRTMAKARVEFHFFPNMTGMSHYGITKELRRWFPDVRVYPRADYSEYMAWLAQCDLVLSTFPFGGTNSTIDCFLVGLPVVTLEGPHVHGRSDASMMRRVGLPDWLITHTKDEYIQAALRVIDGEQSQLDGLRQHLESFNVEKEFYGEAPEALKGGFLAAFESLYEQELQRDQA